MVYYYSCYDYSFALQPQLNPLHLTYLAHSLVPTPCALSRVELMAPNRFSRSQAHDCSIPGRIVRRDSIVPLPTPLFQPPSALFLPHPVTPPPFTKSSLPPCNSFANNLLAPRNPTVTLACWACIKLYCITALLSYCITYPRMHNCETSNQFFGHLRTSRLLPCAAASAQPDAGDRYAVM